MWFFGDEVGRLYRSDDENCWETVALNAEQMNSFAAVLDESDKNEKRLREVIVGQILPHLEEAEMVRQHLHKLSQILALRCARGLFPWCTTHMQRFCDSLFFANSNAFAAIPCNCSASYCRGSDRFDCKRRHVSSRQELGGFGLSRFHSDVVHGTGVAED